MLVAGAAVSLALPAPDPGLVRLLPGLWALLLGLGLFASRPYLARATGWVALFFVLAGGALLAFPDGRPRPARRSARGRLRAGLLAAAVVLHLDLPRDAVS